MIGFLDGVVAGRTLDGCLVDVSGVGYRLACSTITLAQVPADGARCKLWTFTYVREDALALFGFATEGEKSMFEALLGVSGVGPKVALQVCSALTLESFRSALVSDDVAAFAAVPGIGKKTAQRIVIDLKERFAVPDLEVITGGGDVLSLARSALENLGYSTPEVRSVLSQVGADHDDVEHVIRKALKALA